MDDPDFLKYVIGKIPAHELKAAHERYQREKTGKNTFDLWLDDIIHRPDILEMLFRIYTLDEAAKAINESWNINLVVVKRTASDPVKRRTDEITTDEIINFHQSLQ